MRFKSIALVVTLGLALGACTTGTIMADYGSRKDAGYQLPAIPIQKVPQKYHRQIVKYSTKEKAGTIIVDTSAKHLYFVLPEGKAVRYGIGIGREGFGWAGIVEVGRKAEWPTWTPPAEMVERDPNAAKWKDGMPGGPDNPLGARAMYLHENGHDTIYRIHGTSQPWSIGLNISSGCIRMVNDEITDLYDQVEIGAKVIVLLQGAALYKGV